MVRVWYEPPPGGPRSHLNRGAYGVESSMEPLFMKRLARMKPPTVIIPAVGFFLAVCYLPLSKYFFGKIHRFCSRVGPISYHLLSFFGSIFV